MVKGGKMCRTLIALAFILSLSVQAELSWSGSYTFRYTNWGMTAEEVVASESELDPIEKSENMIKYKTRVLDKHVDLIYYFVQNKLVGSLYKIDENYLNSQHFIASYRKFQAALSRKYGPPKIEETNWQSDALRKIGSKKGLALSLGHVDYFSAWETPKTTIACSLKEENYDVNCSIRYRSREFMALEQELKKRVEMDPL
jgi:hypothetical protein